MKTVNFNKRKIFVKHTILQLQTTKFLNTNFQRILSYKKTIYGHELLS